MANMSMVKNPMPSQDPLVRGRNFDEVALGYTEEQVKSEAARCLNCKIPHCRKGCPVNLNIPAFIKAAEKDLVGRIALVVADKSVLVFGSVRPCQSHRCLSKITVE